MIINSGATETAQVVGSVDTSKSMGMNLTPQSYSLILENLYKNPLGAVLRELTTNAVEAHQMAGTTDKKVAIQLPSLLNTDLIIRDFGTGLNNEEIEKYLNCLFSSSKGGDNNTMGGFGLGSKSPLALVDSFTLTSVKDGVQYDYMWIKERGQIPTPIFQGQDETDKENGITITVPLGSSTKVPLTNLQSYVEKEADRQLFGFRDQIMLVEDASVPYDKLVDISDTLFKTNLVLSLPNISFYQSELISSRNRWNSRREPLKTYIQIGSVVYDCSLSMDYQPLSNLISNLDSFVVNLKVPIGQLELPMSREEINTTSENQMVINQVLANALADVSAYIKSLSFNPDTDARGYYAQLKGGQNTPSKSTLNFYLYADRNSLVKKEAKILDIFKDMAKVAIAGGQGSYAFDTSYKFLERCANPSATLLDVFKNFNKDVFNLTALSSNGIRDRVSFVNMANLHTPESAISVIFLPTKLPGNIRYKDVYSYVTSLHPSTRPILMQMDVPNKLLWEEFKKHLEILKEFSSTDINIVGEVDDQVLKDYAKGLKVAAAAAKGTTTVVSENVPGVRLIDLGELGKVDSVDLGAIVARKNLSSGPASSSSLLVGFNGYPVKKRVDDKGKTVPQGHLYINDPSKKILLTDSHYIALDQSALLSQHLTAEVVQFSLSDVIIYKVPSKLLEKTKTSLVSAGYKVYSIDETGNCAEKIAASLPSYSDLTISPSDNTFKTTTSVILARAFRKVLSTTSWRCDKAAILKRLESLLDVLAVEYKGLYKDQITAFIQNASCLSALKNSFFDYNLENVKVGIDHAELEVLNQLAVEITLKSLSTDHRKDTFETSFVQNKVYTSYTVHRYFNSMGFKLYEI